jgi:hypothetical protein
MEFNINEKLERVMQRKYLVHERKLKNLREKMESRPSNNVSTQYNHLNSPLHKFYPKVVNQTSIDFTKEELTLLNKGLQYNLHGKNKNWFTNLAIEADTAISLADIKDQDFLKRTIAQKSSQARHKKQKFIIEKRILRSLKEKLELNKACITSADKGKTIVVLSRSDYSGKISVHQ